MAAVYLSVRCCVLSFKAGCRENPVSVALLCKHKSRCNECVMAGELDQTKCTDVPCVLTVHQRCVVPHNHLQSCVWNKAGSCTLETDICLTHNHVFN